MKTIVCQLGRQKHTLKDDGRTLRVTTVELLLRVLRAKAMAGDIRADKYLEQLRGRFMPRHVDGVYVILPDNGRMDTSSPSYDSTIHGA